MVTARLRVYSPHKSQIPGRTHGGRFLRMLTVLASATLILSHTHSSAQEPLPFPSVPVESSSLPTVRTEVQEVPLVLSVTDHKGRYVDTLTQSDLTILDNDQSQKDITYFEHET